MSENYIRNVVEAALLAAGRPLQLAELAELFEESSRPEQPALRATLEALEVEYTSRGIEVKETATGFRIQVRRGLANEVSRLWPERPPRYSRALLETLALIAYRQPITRAEIEAVRGVAVNPNIIKTILERNWVRVVGTRDVPGRPELLGTTKEFLDYFGLRSLEDLPPLAELKAMGEINLQLDLAKPGEPSGSEGGSEGGAGGANGASGEGSAGSEGGSGNAVAAVAGLAAVVTIGAAAEGAVASDDAGSAAATNDANESTADAAGEANQPGAVDKPGAANDPGAGNECGVAHEHANARGAASVLDDQANALGEANQLVETNEAGEAGVISQQGDATSDREADEPAGEAELGSAEPALAPVVAHAEVESDSGDVTVEVETLVIVEASIEATMESDQPPPPAADSAIESGEFELAELGMSAPPSVSVIEAEFEAEDLDSVASDDDSADDEAADDEEQLSAGPQSSTELVAAPRDRDD